MKLKLAELQRRMASAVMRPLTGDYRMQRQWTDGSPSEDMAAGFIKPNDRLTSFERLEIYNRQYWFRVLDCLYDDYPGLRAVLGDEKFQRLIRAYLEKNPSTSFTLRNLGQYLVDFLRTGPEWTRPYQKLALDMARLEWAQIEAFDNASRPPVKPQQIAAVPPSELHLKLQPHITLLELAYPVDKMVVRILRQDDKLRSEASNAVENVSRPRKRSIAGRIRPEKVHLAVHRVDNVIYFKRLEAAEFRVLKAIESGASLEDACNAAGKPSSALSRKLGLWFRDWSSFGWFWMKAR